MDQLVADWIVLTYKNIDYYEDPYKIYHIVFSNELRIRVYNGFHSAVVIKCLYHNMEYASLTVDSFYDPNMFDNIKRRINSWLQYDN